MAQKSQRHYKGYSITKKTENSYLIRISDHGQRYNYLFHAPEQLTESKQYAAAEKEAIQLRDKVKMGYVQKMPTFRAYADYVLQTKQDAKVRDTTLNQYKYLLPRLLDEFGDDLLDQITPVRLNRFYGKLQSSEVMIPASALAIPQKLIKYLKANDITYKRLHDMSGVAENTISLAVRGTKVSSNTAERICKALDLNIGDYFYIISNSRPISGKTVQEHIRLLNTILKTAVKERILEYNPVDGSTPPRIEKKPVNYYQPDEISKIWECLANEDIRWQMIISLLIVTGCRRSEIIGLRWDNILWDNALIHIDHEVLYNEDQGLYIFNATKNLDEKYVQVDQTTMDQLRDFRKSFEADMHHLRLPEEDWPEYIFYQAEDVTMPMHPSSINRFLTRFSEKYGFRKINPHALRHSLASALIADGVDVYAVSKQLGHKRESTTREIYAHQINDHQAKVAERIPEIYHRPNRNN